MEIGFMIGDEVKVKDTGVVNRIVELGDGTGTAFLSRDPFVYLVEELEFVNRPLTRRLETSAVCPKCGETIQLRWGEFVRCKCNEIFIEELGGVITIGTRSSWDNFVTS